MSEYCPRNVMVTGGAGFIGCNFIRFLFAKDKNATVVNVDALTYAGNRDNLTDVAHPDRHVFVEGDICDDALVDRLLRQYNIDTIVHFAAESHVDNSISGPGVFVQTNVLGTHNLLDAARRYWLDEKKWGRDRCRFHHISTDEVYGTLTADDSPFSESTRYAPNSPYSASKAGSDHFVRAYFHTYGLPVTISNCSNNYGPYQHGEKFIPTVIRSCLASQKIPVYGDGSNIRDWLYVEDHCSAIDVIIRRGVIGDVYNIGGLNEWSNLDICHRICGIMDELRPANESYALLIAFVADRPGHDWRYAIDASKIASQLDWHPTETFETGIRKCVQWYLDRAA